MRVLAFLVFSFLTVSAHAREIQHVCGVFDGAEKFFGTGSSKQSALGVATRACRRDGVRPEKCTRSLCKAIKQPTRVSELPKNVQRDIRVRAAARYREQEVAARARRAQEDRDTYIERHAGPGTSGTIRTDIAGTTHYEDGTSSRRAIDGSIHFSDGRIVSPGSIRTDILGDIHYGDMVCHRDITGRTTCRKE